MSATEAPSRTVLVEEFCAVRRNTLRGFAKIKLPCGLILTDVAIHIGGDNKAWASPASKAMLSGEGVALRDESGKIRYSPIVSFATKDVRDRFSQSVIEAVRASFPEALAS